MTKFVTPITRDNLHQFKKFKIVSDSTGGAVGDVCSLKMDDGSTMPRFRNETDRSSKWIKLENLAGIVEESTIPDTTTILRALDDASAAIDAARKALLA